MENNSQNTMTEAQMEDAYLDELLCGKKKVWEIPAKYRTHQAYTYAFRWIYSANSKYSKSEIYMQVKLLETSLLSDIIASSSNKELNQGKTLEYFYKDHFTPGNFSYLYDPQW